MAASQNKFSSNLVAMAGLITAIAGLLTVLHQTGVIFNDSKTTNNEDVKEVIEPKKKTKDSETTILTNDSRESQKEIGVIKKQIEDTQVQLDQMKEVNKKTISNTAATNFNTNRVVILTGTWQDTINYGRYVFGQDANGSLTFQEHSLVEGSWIVTSEGTGLIENNIVKLNYITLYGTSGKFNGSIQSDNSIKGIATDNVSGIQVQLHLKRQ